MANFSNGVHLQGEIHTSSTKEYADMRKAVEKYGGSSKVGDEETCTRVLVDCSMNVEKAAKQFAKYQKMTETFMPLGYIPDSEVSSLLNEEMLALQGKTKKGCPLVVALACKHHANKHDLETIKKFIVYTLEKSLASAPGSRKLVAIADLTNLGLKCFDFKFFSTSFQMMQKYYPGIAFKVYMVNVPKFLINTWNAISRVLTKSARDRIVFVESHEMASVLLSEVDAEVLPKACGGEADLVLIQDVKLEGWSKAAVNLS